MARYVLTRTAQKDIEAIWVYFAKRSGSFEVAERAISRLRDKIAMLAAYPLSARQCDFHPQWRCAPIDSYLIYYRERNGKIQVTQVVHARRSQAKAWKAKRAGS